MPTRIKPGTVILPRAGGSHPHVVLSEPFGVEKFVLVVNWATLDAECIDDACVLQPGDHAVVSHPSSMAYSWAHLWRGGEKIFLFFYGCLNPTAPGALPPLFQ